MEDVFKNTRRVFDALPQGHAPTNGTRRSRPGITAVATPGHTPGHTSFVVVVRREQGLSCRPTSPTIRSLFARNPGWHVFFDQDPEMAEATRRKVYDMLVAEKMLVQGFHYPFPSVALCREGRRPAIGKSR